MVDMTMQHDNEDRELIEREREHRFHAEQWAKHGLYQVTFYAGRGMRVHPGQADLDRAHHCRLDLPDGATVAEYAELATRTLAAHGWLLVRPFILTETGGSAVVTSA